MAFVTADLGFNNLYDPKAWENKPATAWATQYATNLNIYFIKYIFNSAPQYHQF